MVQVRVNGISVAVDAITKLAPSLEKSVLLRMSQIAYDSAQAGADRHTKTGALFQSLYNRQIPNGREVGHDPTRAPHAAFVNFGTRAHDIRPKNKKALRWASGGSFTFAKVVHHPGYIGDAYIARAADEAIRRFAEVVDTSLKEQA